MTRSARAPLWRLAPLIAAAALGLAATAPADDPPPPSDRTAILGIWTIASGEEHGKPIPSSQFTGQTVAFDETTYVVKLGDKVIEKGTYTIDASKEPRSLDLKISESQADKNKSQLGIYRLQADTLKLCLAPAGTTTRPTKFETTSESNHFALGLKRKPAESK